eukprot:m.254621 g.254621  ORF g.254621 m.254621 type:complete len:1271 (-) comp22682_c3_seq6:83-3895(-)
MPLLAHHRSNSSSSSSRTPTAAAAAAETSTDDVNLQDYADSDFLPLKQSFHGFGVRLTQLVELISERGTKGMERLAVQFGGYEGLADKLQTSQEAGIKGTPEDLLERQRLYGANRIPTSKSKSIWQLMWDALQDTTLIILVIAGVLSLVLELTIGNDPDVGWIEGVAIIIAVVIVVLVTAINDLQKEKQFQALLAKQNETKMTDVIRDGKQIRVSEFDLVVGDLWVVTAGSIVPTDGVLVRASDVSCDESALTGESRDINKSLEKDPWMLSGTSVKQGSGLMIVTCVGLFSEEGIINKLITGVGQEESQRLNDLNADLTLSTNSVVRTNELRRSKSLRSMTDQERKQREREAVKKQRKKESVLQVKLTKMALQIGKAGTFVAVVTVLVLILRYVIEEFAVDGKSWSGDVPTDLLQFFIVGVTVLVVAVPEGLPLAVTISLAYSVKKMMKDNNLVRVLAACETMGNATTICSDKTGTLTKNRMTVVQAWVAGKIFKNIPEAKSLHPKIRENIALHAAVNSSTGSTYRFKEGDRLPVQDGNKTECAILLFADQIFEQTHSQIRESHPSSSYVKIFPFDSARKRMTTVIQLPDGRYRVFAKGASEIILKLCGFRQDENANSVPLTDKDYETFQQDIIVAFAEEALRVICIAFRDFDEARNWDDENDLLQNMTISAFVGIQDPVRDEVPDAVKQCQSAGVVVRMVTGDNMITARAIAYNCGIIQPGDDSLVLEGPDFRRMVVKDDKVDHEALAKIWQRLRVIGRCSPRDKYHLVQGLIHAGQVVAVTGDGTNDGPALSEADVGFAMGIAGTGVAKEASDIIITDDNFSSIVKAISWGRNVYDSISKFLVFQLTVNIVAISVAFIGACALNESPIRAVQLLWVNLIMDTFASLALATEPPTPELLKRDPYGRHQPLISRIMARQMVGHSLYQLPILLILVFAGDKIFDIESGRQLDHNADPTRHYTIVFNTFVLMQIFNEINARKIHNQLNVFSGFFNNPIFVGIIVGTLAVQALIVEFGGRAFSVTGLTGVQWLVCILIGMGELVWNVVIHFIFPYTVLPESWFKAKPKKKRTIVNVEGGEEEEAEEEEDSIASIIGDDDPHAFVTRPEDAHRLGGLTPGSLLWTRSLTRLRTHIRVVSAFKSAGHRTRLRRRTSELGHLALGGPDARAHPQPHPEETPAAPAALPPTPATAMWRTAAARIRFQLRVANAFRQGLQRSASVGRRPTASAAPAAAAGGFQSLHVQQPATFIQSPDAPVPPPSPTMTSGQSMESIV